MSTTTNKKNWSNENMLVDVGGFKEPLVGLLENLFPKCEQCGSNCWVYDPYAWVPFVINENEKLFKRLGVYM